MKGLLNQVAIVTGGGGAIGKSICLRLAEEGTVVGVLDLNKEAATATVDTITQAGGRAHAIAVDITDYKAVLSAIKEFEQSQGGVDVLVNNAGWDRIANFIDTSPEFWERVVKINYQGTLNVTHAVITGMAGRGAGRVINIASDAGRVGSSGEAVYAGCKAAVIAFGKTIARELAGQNITVNAVCPGPTDTPLFWAAMANEEVGQKIADGLKRAIPLKRLGQPEDLAGIVAFLATSEASFITGQVISVSGGLTMHG
ncbi:MAG: SDR family oxidoreductase [Rhizobium sp.]